MKKWLSMLMVVTLSASALMGCSGGKQAEPTTQAASQAVTEAPAQTSGEQPAAEPETAAGDQKLTVGLSMFTLEYPFYVTMYDGFVKACEDKGWEIITTNASTDVATQLNDCMDLIGKDIDVLALSSWYGDSLSEVFDACKEKNIPVFLMDTSTLPENPEFVTRTGTVNYDAGHIGGAWTAKYFTDQGITQVDAIALHSGDATSTDRKNGFIEGMEENGLKVNLLNEYFSTSREEAMSNMDDALVTYSKIDLIVGTSAQHGLGAYGACVSANRQEMKIVAMDGEQEEMDAINESDIYLCTVMQFPEQMAIDTVQNIEDYVFNGKQFEKFIPSPAGVYCDDGIITSDKIEN